MDFSWGGIQKSINEFWNKLSRPQKIITIAAPLLVAVALSFLIFWASRPEYAVIFNGISDADAGAVTSKLNDLKVDYKLADNGSTILVPQKQAAEIRLQLANAGLPQGSKFSFDSLNQMHLGETDEDRKLRYILGLQNELETTLKTLKGVQDARVHIVIPEPSLFEETQNDATAAVTLQLVLGNNLSEDQIRGVANLLAASVEGLKPENVTIVDTNGNVLSDVLGNSNDPKHLTGSQIQLQQVVESNIQKSLQSMLDRVLGPGKTVVRANATLDFDQIKITQQKNGPGALVSKQTTTETSSNGSAPGSVPGVETNVPGYQTPVSSGSSSSSSKTSNTENYQVDVIQEERVVSPGAIKRLSVSVTADAESVTQTQVEQIQSIVASAAGIDQTRGDQIQVAAIPFNKTSLLEEKAAIAETQRKQQIVTYAELGAGVLFGIVVLLAFLRHRSKKKRESNSLILEQGLNNVPLAAAEEMLMAQQQAEEEAKLKMAQKMAKSAEEIERQKVKESVEAYTKNNPDEVARLVKAWLTEER